MPEITIEIFCDTCGAGLCGETTAHKNSFHVNPCKRCLETAREEGFEDGFKKGRKEGFEDGKRSCECQT